MKKINFPIYFLLFAVIFSNTSCSVMYVANPTIEPIVFAKPMHRDTAFTSNYIGGKYSNTHYLNMYNDIIGNNLGQVNIYQTYTRKYFNTSYGAFAYMGNIKIADYLNNNPRDNDNKNYYGFGTSADVQLNIPIGRFALRPIGGRFSVLYENGEYARYKNEQLAALGIINNFVSTTISQTFGADYYFKKSSIGFNFSGGFVTSYPSVFFDFGYASNIVYTYERFSVYLQQSGNLLLNNSDFVVGVSYRLPK
jgi:hypothetical protein